MVSDVNGSLTRDFRPRLSPYLALLLATACPDPKPTAPKCTDAGPLPIIETSDHAPMDMDEGRPHRLKCEFGPDAQAVETVGPRVPHGSEIPIDHILVLMLENRSFDHLLAEMSPDDADVSRGAVNFGREGESVQQEPATSDCSKHDLNHEWEAVELQWHRGRMDGFAVTNPAPPGETPLARGTMSYHTKDQIPFYYWLTENFASNDRYFSSLLGATWPNRYFFYAATSWGRTVTPEGGPRDVQIPVLDGTTIFDRLEGHSVRVYSDNHFVPGAIESHTRLILPAETFEDRTIADFETDALNDTLPDVGFIEPIFNGDEKTSDHPPGNITRTQVFVHDIVTKLGESKSWGKSVLFITYDEHGGYFDHVPPPPACPPDDLRAEDHAFDRFGVRVPLFIVSPWVTRPGYVSHFVADHTSITRFIETRFGLGAMTARDANAWPLMDAFDFTPKTSPPVFPAGAPVPTVSSEVCP